MTAELVRGQNHPLPRTRLEIRVSAGTPIVAGATLGDEHGTVRGTEWVAHPGTPTLPGLEVSRQAAADHRLAVDLEALPQGVHRVSVLLALPPGAGPSRFAAVAAPFVAVTGLDGTEVATYTITGLDAESAVVALELYRRAGVWKVRAIGQGYAGGLADMLVDQGLPQARELAAVVLDAVALGASRSVAAPPPRTADEGRVRTGGASGARGSDEVPAGAAPSSEAPQQPLTDSGPVDYAHPRRKNTAPPPPPPTAPPAAPGEPAPPVAGDATGWSMEERLYNQVWGMFEDLARTTAAYRSAVDFADSRMEQELDRALADPRSRIGSTGDLARQEAATRREQLVDRAREAFDRDVAHLTAESEVVEPALPAAYARWDNPVWHAYRVPMEIPMALRVGDLRLPERPELRIPMLVRLPLERGLWIDSGRSGSEAAAFMDAEQVRRLAGETAVALAARLLAVYPAHEFAVHVVDPAGTAAGALAPLTR
ncbi:TerD family protein, partial [Streptomyces sp. NPDC005877]